MFNLICDSATVEPHRTWEVEVSSQDLEGLMVDLLTDMLVLFETDGMLASSVEVDVTTVDDQWRAVAKVRGEPYDGDRHELLHDIKAATYHTREVLQISKQALGSDEIQLVREYLTESPAFEAEVWYYAETKVKGYQFVIRLGVVADKGVVELFAASTAMEPITGLLADFRRELNHVLDERYAEEARMVVDRDEQLRRDMERRPLRLDAASDD